MSTSDSESHITTVKTILSIAGTIAATVVVVRGVAQEFLPSELQDYVYSGARKMFSRLSNELTVVVEESDGLDGNEIYEAAKIYLESKIGATMRRLKISKNKKEKHLDISMERDEEVVDVYDGQKFKWVWVSRRMEGHVSQNPRLCEMRSFELTFHKRNRKMVIDSYLPFIINAAKTRKREKKTLRIFTADYQNNYDMSQIWKPVTLNHPSTFETLAMDSGEKDMILKDVERFLGRREYYRKVGKAWKRGYLLYGPPGTGKSSLIAAMANYLNFDVYDLELTELTRNSNLRNVLLATADKSILVVEDIDCAIDLNEKLANRDDSFQGNHHPNENQVTLSGLLNLIDGLWSSCGDERIIIFTTNHIEKLDPALLRPGRMDVHIHMSYCSPCGFKQLAANYLGIKDHPLLQQIQDLLPNAKATPAEVAEQLLKNDDPDLSLQALLGFLHEKMVKIEEAEAEKAKAAAETAEKQENARQRNMEKRSMVLTAAH